MYRTLQDSIKEMCDQRSKPATETRLVERLKKRFGLGQSPQTRMALYLRLERLLHLHGEIIEVLIAEAIMQSVGMRDPAIYFCKAICCKVRDHKFTTWSGPDVAKGGA